MGVVFLPLAFIKTANWHPRDPKPLDPAAGVCSACSELSPLLCLSVSFSLVPFSSSFVMGGGKREGGVFCSPSRFCLAVSVRKLY